MHFFRYVWLSFAIGAMNKLGNMNLSIELVKPELLQTLVITNVNWITAVIFARTTFNQLISIHFRNIMLFQFCYFYLFRTKTTNWETIHMLALRNYKLFSFIFISLNDVIDLQFVHKFRSENIYL